MSGSFGHMYRQFSNWLRRPPRRRTAPNRRAYQPPVLESLESRLVPTGTWTKLAHAAPSGIGTMMLLSDGTVMAQGSGTVNTWYKLAPDASGSYVNGTWSTRASMHVQRLYFGSNILPDGRAFVIGGEYSSDGGFSHTGEIYNPVTNTWTNTANFPQSRFGDDPTEVLPDGRILAGYVVGSQTYIYNPTTNTWSSTGSKLQNDNSDEETWTKLPDGSILSYNICVNNPSGCTRGNAQRYVPSSGTWVATSAGPNNLSSPGVGYEMGPALLLPDGRVFQIGATGQTAYYDPSANRWTAGPAVPSSLGADDAPGAMMPNGHILFAADRPLFGSPMKVFEFDPTTNTYTDRTPPSNIISTTNPAYLSRMLMLPNGQVLLTTSGNQLAVWTPDGSPDPSWQPTISDISDNGDGTFTLSGTQLNGISEGASYGDDAEMSSNYPIVQLDDGNGHIYYARTYNWSSTGVATGSTPVSTQFAVPANLPGGTYTLTVIANGIASDGVSFTVGGPSQLGLAVDNPTPTAGDTVNVSVSALDANGNVVPSYRGTVHFTSSDTQAGLPSDYTFTAADNGVHTFAVTLYTAGDQTVTATDTTTGSITGTASVSVQAGAAVGFYIAAPSSAGSGTAFDVTIYAVDPYYNVDTNYQGTITWTSTDSDPGVVLPADYQFQASDQGVVTFPGGVTLITAGDQFITVTDTSDNTITGSADVTVTTPGPVPHGSRPNLVALTISPLAAAQGSTRTGSIPSTAAHGTASNLEDGGIDRFFATTGRDANLLRSGQETMTALHLALDTSRAMPSWELLAPGLERFTVACGTPTRSASEDSGTFLAGASGWCAQPNGEPL